MMLKKFAAMMVVAVLPLMGLSVAVAGPAAAADQYGSEDCSNLADKHFDLAVGESLWVSLPTNVCYWVYAGFPRYGDVTVDGYPLSPGGMSSTYAPMIIGYTAAVPVTDGPMFTFYSEAGTVSYYVTTVGGVPSAPGAPTVDGVGDKWVDVIWGAPELNGGSPLTGYQVGFSDNGGVSWLGSAEFGADSTFQRMTDLVNGTSYVFRVRASNAFGWGDWSDVSGAGVPSTVADAPTGASASFEGNHGELLVNWSGPENDGGSPITDYRIDYSADGGANWTSYAHETSTTWTMNVSGLTNGVPYVFRVGALNGNGWSGWSNTTNAATPVTHPDVPTNVSGVGGDSSVALSWTAGFNGGAPVSNYRVWYSSDAGTHWTEFEHLGSPSPSMNVSGLTNGVPYVFEVMAFNELGLGSDPSATSDAFTPVAPAPVPTPVAPSPIPVPDIPAVQPVVPVPDVPAVQPVVPVPDVPAVQPVVPVSHVVEVSLGRHGTVTMTGKAKAELWTLVHASVNTSDSVATVRVLYARGSGVHGRADARKQGKVVEAFLARAGFVGTVNIVVAPTRVHSHVGQVTVTITN